MKEYKININCEPNIFLKSQLVHIAKLFKASTDFPDTGCKWYIEYQGSQGFIPGGNPICLMPKQFVDVWIHLFYVGKTVMSTKNNRADV